MMRFILTTTFLFSHLFLLGQDGEQSRAVILKNRVKTVKVYADIPKTNPNYYNSELKGYSFIGQSSYDKDGRLIETICVECDESPGRDENGFPRVSFLDRVEKYFYKNDRLVTREESGKETKLFNYLVDSINNRRLIIGTKKGKRFSVGIETLDKSNRETQFVNINFEYSSTEGDTTHQIFFSRTTIDYSPLLKTVTEFGNNLGIDIDKRTYEIFLNSVDIEEIVKGFLSLKLDNKLGQRNLKTISYDKNGNELKLVNSDAESTFYRDKLGLITKEIYRFPKFKDVRVYRYGFW